MKNSIISEIYNGNLDPLETILPTDPEYRKLNQKIGGEIEDLKKKLDEKDGEQLENLQDMNRSLSAMYAYASFTYGMKLGALFMCEIFDGENSPDFCRGIVPPKAGNRIKK